MGRILVSARLNANVGLRRGCQILGLAVALLLAPGAAKPAGADTTVETSITLTTQNSGEFTIAFADVEGGYTFVNATGGTSFKVSATKGDTATAFVMLAWTDSRVDEQRSGYTIGLSASDLISGVNRPDGNGDYVIPSANLAITRIGNDTLASPMSLDQQRLVFSSGTAPSAGERTLRVELQLAVPPSSYPTTYTTKLQVQVTHGDGGP
ncbi:MAG: hypothetical protein QOF73_5202 [Thermomicrobiales bacterium]|nr:hypothetical protein [Thermomicrobiales bacterium]